MVDSIPRPTVPVQQRDLDYCVTIVGLSEGEDGKRKVAWDGERDGQEEEEGVEGGEDGRKSRKKKKKKRKDDLMRRMRRHKARSCRAHGCDESREKGEKYCAAHSAAVESNPNMRRMLYQDE